MPREEGQHEFEVRLVVTANQELSNEQQELLARDVVISLLENHGARSRFGLSRRVEKVRFRQYNWESRRYIGPENSQDFCITQDERRVWESDPTGDDF